MQAVAKSQKIKKSTSTKVFYVICYIFVALMALVCLLPFIMVVSGSFSSEQAIRFQGYGILPREFTTAAYALIFKSPMTVVRAYGVSIFITLAGTAVGLLLTTMTAYVISRKDFKYRNALSFFFYFTTLFNGGMVCSYIFYIQYLHLKDSYLALILPGVFNVFYLLIMRTFVSAIPTALIESAKIDGAGEFKTFFSIILPLLKSGMATIGLFLALGYWNDWYNAMLYMNTETKYPLLFSSGEEFDMAYSASWLNFASLAQKGAFKSLDELWPTYAPKNFAAQTEEAKQQATVNGSYYCVPSLLSTYNAYGPFYRGDLVEGTEWDGKMETFEDIEEYCDIIKETHPEMECIDLYSTAPEIFFMYMENQGLATFNGIRYLWYDPNAENPTVMTSYELEKTPEFLEMMARWNEKGFYSKSALSDTDSTKFQNGKAALKIHNIDSYVGQAILHPEYDIHYSNMVKDVAHLPYTQDCMVISNTSKNPERAMALWDLITNDQEVYDAFYYGIEGTSYELNDEGQFKILDTDNYGTSAMWSARSDALNRQQIGTPDDYKTNIDEFESHIVSGQGNEKFTGFVLDTSSFETQLAACNNVQQQYWWPLELGYTDAESGLADYQSQMEAAGIEAMKEAAQKQLDAYVASLK